MMSLLQKVADEQAEAERRRRIASGEITEDAEETGSDGTEESVESDSLVQPQEQDEQGKGH
jgi:hypothetical protein